MADFYFLLCVPKPFSLSEIVNVAYRRSEFNSTERLCANAWPLHGKISCAQLSALTAVSSRNLRTEEAGVFHHVVLSAASIESSGRVMTVRSVALLDQLSR